MITLNHRKTTHFITKKIQFGWMLPVQVTVLTELNNLGNPTPNQSYADLTVKNYDLVPQFSGCIIYQDFRLNELSQITQNFPTTNTNRT